MTQAGGTRWLMQSRGAGAVEPVLCCVLLRVPLALDHPLQTDPSR